MFVQKSRPECAHLGERLIVKKIAVIIVAAGRGSRAGEGLPKQYRRVAGVMLLRRTIDAVAACDPSAQIQVIIHKDDLSLYNKAVEGLSLLKPVVGGDTRQESVLNGLKALEARAPDYILVHDAARPFVSKVLFNGVIDQLMHGARAVIPAVSMVDTLKLVEGNQITRTIDRDHIVAVQTPQGFCFGTLLAAHTAANNKGLTDDGAVMESAGHKVETSVGDSANFKITNADDFTKAEAVIMNANADVRVGSGYDVHRFEAGDHLWLCGIKLPFEKSLKGHSDADVGLHALTDALLSAVAAGDIGTHFPPSDAQWRGASSDIFIKKAVDIIHQKGGIIAHVSLCLICERPKIGPHNAAMRARVADLLGINTDRVSIQATTTEKLGFTGREEGIAAQATATVRLPF
jgi:2-C-methyl-D-erythritol 4-phosphate cytidylyltransferase / 2-C-methyl-D-erythritol 2,4-cyclodiphosphate synthase